MAHYDRLLQAIHESPSPATLTDAHNAFYREEITSEQLESIVSLYRVATSSRTKAHPRVFVAEPVQKDISDALRFGELAVMFPETQHRQSVWEPGIDYAVMRRLQALKFDAQSDYFLVVGTQVLLMSTAACLTKLHGSFKALYWHASMHEYVSRVVGATNDA